MCPKVTLSTEWLPRNRRNGLRFIPVLTPRRCEAAFRSAASRRRCCSPRLVAANQPRTGQRSRVSTFPVRYHPAAKGVAPPDPGGEPLPTPLLDHEGRRVRAGVVSGTRVKAHLKCRDSRPLTSQRLKERERSPALQKLRPPGSLVRNPNSRRAAEDAANFRIIIYFLSSGDRYPKVRGAHPTTR